MFGRIVRPAEDSGFTMVEVLFAMLLIGFMVLGTTGLLTNASGNIKRSAMETKAATLASQKLEQVRSLPFYQPWESSKGKRDIDDYYYNADSGNKNDGQLEGPGTNEGNELSVPGDLQFSRKTRVQYEYLNTSSNPQQLDPAVMYSPNELNKWVPSNPSIALPPSTDRQTDKPIGGATATNGQPLHAIIIEVTVSWTDGTGNHNCKERALAGDRLNLGGYNAPPLVVEKIEPVEYVRGTVTNDVLTLKVYVDAPGLRSTDAVDVSLWYPQQTDVVGYKNYSGGTYSNPGATVNSNGTELTCYMDMKARIPKVARVGRYNISVTWKAQGFTDRTFRECFKLVPGKPSLDPTTPLQSYDWGWRDQQARVVTINGSNLEEPETVQLIGPDTLNPRPVVTGVVSSAQSTNNRIVATFNLTGNTADRPLRSLWDVKVTTAHPDAAIAEKKFKLNPEPIVDSIDGLVNGYRGAGVVSTITVHGHYFQDYPYSPQLYLINCWDGPGHTLYDGVLLCLGSGTVSADGETISGIQEDLSRHNFHTVNPSWGQSRCLGYSSLLSNTTYKAWVQNQGPDYGVAWPNITRTFQNATMSIDTTPSTTTFYTNDFGARIGPVTGRHIPDQYQQWKVDQYGNTIWQLETVMGTNMGIGDRSDNFTYNGGWVTEGGTWYAYQDPPPAPFTDFSKFSWTIGAQWPYQTVGSYASDSPNAMTLWSDAQGGAYLNLVGIPPGNYRCRIWDQDTYQSVYFDFTIVNGTVANGGGPALLGQTAEHRTRGVSVECSRRTGTNPEQSPGLCTFDNDTYVNPYSFDDPWGNTYQHKFRLAGKRFYGTYQVDSSGIDSTLTRLCFPDINDPTGGSYFFVGQTATSTQAKVERGAYTRTWIETTTWFYDANCYPTLHLNGTEWSPVRRKCKVRFRKDAGSSWTYSNAVFDYRKD